VFDEASVVVDARDDRRSLMVGDNLALYVAAYADAASASEDFQSLKDAQGAGDEFKVIAAAILSRDADGKVDVKEHGTHDVAAGTGMGAVGGLVVGLFAPPLLLATAVGAGVGAGIGELVKRHEEKKIGVDVEEYLPPGSSAIAVVIDDRYLDRVENALTKSTKKVSKAIDSGDYDKIKKAINDAGYNVDDALES
jgi:uncharacterized membrane protein